MRKDLQPASVVEVDGLCYRYPRRETLALDGIAFTVDAGQFVGVIGPNRAGKSTLCHALVGLVPHFYKGAIGGRVTVAGLDVRASSVAEVSRRAGLVFQNPFTQVTGAKLTVYEEVAFGLEYAGVPRDDMVRRIEEALQLLGLWELRDRNPFALSGGQMQRMAIASVLAMEPQVLVLDEPTSQLDPAGAREVFDAVASLCERGVTVIMAEHDVERLVARADRLVVLHDGKMAAYDSPRFVYANVDVRALGLEIPAVTEAAMALQWRLPDGTYPVTIDEAAAAAAKAARAGWEETP